jgi:hypothetical protein
MGWHVLEAYTSSQGGPWPDHCADRTAELCVLCWWVHGMCRVAPRGDVSLALVHPVAACSNRVRGGLGCEAWLRCEEG